MAEVIRERVVDSGANHTHSDNSSGNGLGFLIGIIVLAVVLYVLFMFGLPMIRSAATPQIPERVDVNVNTPAQPGQ